jgi:hypothetical protein
MHHDGVVIGLEFQISFLAHCGRDRLRHCGDEGAFDVELAGAYP